MDKIRKVVLLLFLAVSAYGLKGLLNPGEYVDVSGVFNTGATKATISSTAVTYNAEDICNAVKTNKTIRVGVYNYYDNKSYYMSSPASSCNNSTVFDEKKSDIQKGSSYVRFGRITKANKVYIDNVLVKKANNYGNYAYFYVSNRARPTALSNSSYTLKPGETPFIYMNVSDKNIKGGAYKDLRLSITYGVNASDTNILTNNSIIYYVYTNNGTYGPYSLATADYQNIYMEQDSNGKNTQLTIYELTSASLSKEIPSSDRINAIKFYPYYRYPVLVGSFKLFNIALGEYKSNKSYVKVNGAEDKIRHNVVNNMMENVTVKWNVVGNTTLHFYHHYVTEPIIMKPNKNQHYYGIPYVNTSDTTIGQFTHQTTKTNTKYYSYKFTDTYLVNATSNHGKEIKAGAKIPNNILYVHERNADNEKKGTRKKEIENTNLHFVANSSPFYYLGLDCSSATYLAVGRDVPTTDTMAGSKRYFSSGQVAFLGGLNVTMRSVEKSLRSSGALKKTEHMTADLYKANYSKYLKNTYGAQKIYNNYALVVPGDIIDKYGHVRLVSGKTHVVCKKDNQVTDSYKPGFCSSHGGIDPAKSYVITTEVGGRHEHAYARSSTHIDSSKTGWKYTLNSALTDLKSVDDLYNSSKKLMSIFNVNIKYTFNSLYNGDYYGFRYKDITNNISANKIEKPVARFVLDKTYSNANQTVYDYAANNKKLKGTIFTNYLIDAIKFEINGKKYYQYIGQAHAFSLYRSITNTSVLNAIKNLNYKNKNTIKVGVKFGPNIDAVRKAAGADSEGYVTVLNTTGLTAKIIVKSTGIKLNKTSATVFAGKTLTLTATITPSNTTNKAVAWTSSNTKVATVSTAGVVKGVGNGTATITVKTNDTGKTATAKITVKTHVTGVRFKKSSTTINKGKTEKMTVEVLPETASDKTVTWKSNNTSVATVDAAGIITAKAAGTATITATTNDGAKTATVKVTVTVPTVRVTGVKLSKTSTSIKIGASEKMTATVSPSNATNKSVTWKSSNSSVATVDAVGTIMAKAVGSANITVTTNDNAKTATVKVTVLPIAVQSVKLNRTNIPLELNETVTLVATITPSNATNKKVTWSSSNKNVATVDQNGKVVAKGAGTAVVTVKTSDGAKTASAKVSVSKPDPIIVKPIDDDDDEDIDKVLTTGIKLDKTDVTIKVGKTIALSVSVTPKNATDKRVSWTTSNAKVATVSSSGAIKGVSSGTVTITVTTKDTGLTAKATVRVVQASSGGSTTITPTPTPTPVPTPTPTDGEKEPSNDNGDSSAPGDGSGNQNDDPIGDPEENHDDVEPTNEYVAVPEDTIKTSDGVFETVRNVVIGFVAVVAVGGGILFLVNRRKY